MSTILRINNSDIMRLKGDGMSDQPTNNHHGSEVSIFTRPPTVIAVKWLQLAGQKGDTEWRGYEVNDVRHNPPMLALS